MFRLLMSALLALCLMCSSAAGAEETPLRVTASFYPLYIAAINVARDVPGVEVHCMAPPSAGCLHDYQMTTADRRMLADSDVVILNGLGLESFMDALLPSLSAATIIASRDIPVINDKDGPNPHVWVSVEGMMDIVMNIALGLSAQDPDHQEAYLANANAYIETLEALYREMQTALSPYADVPIITFHEAFDYFARSFDLRVVATVQHAHEGAPSAREMADLADLIKAENVRALFAEPQYEDTSVEILSRETGVPVYLLDPAVSGEIDPQDYEAYVRIMRANTATLVEALQ